MINPECLPRHISRVAAIGLVLASCGEPAPSGMHEPIESALGHYFPMYNVTTGFNLRLNRSLLSEINAAADAGLVTLHQVDWNPGVGHVVATPRLLDIASNPADIMTQKDWDEFTGGEWEPPDEYRRRVERMKARVKLFDIRLNRIVTDEPYIGPLASPGEQHRLILGTFTSGPTSGATVLGMSVQGPQGESQHRFRCVLRYSDFKKEWTVAACDIGTVDPERWLGNEVR